VLFVRFSFGAMFLLTTNGEKYVFPF